MNNPHTLTPVEFDPFEGPALLRVVPTTEAQREILAIAVTDERASRAFNVLLRITIDGELDKQNLDQALQETVDRHGVLHSCFSPDGLNLCLRMARKQELEMLDISEISAGEQTDRLSQVERGESEKNFDLVNGPLYRHKLVRLGQHSHVLFFTVHHIVCDGWSTSILMRELCSNYRRACGVDSEELPVAADFGDFAEWCATNEGSPDHQAAERYWSEKFADEPDPLDLPGDSLRPAEQSYSGSMIRVDVPKDLVSEIRRAGAKSGCTIGSVLLAAYAILLQKLSRNRDIVIGTTFAGQMVYENSHLVGHCVNFLPMRIDVDPEREFSVQCKQVSSQLLDAREHQFFTLATLIRKLKIRRSTGRTPIISASFSYQSEGQFPEWPDLDVGFNAGEKAHTNLDLVLEAVELDGSISLDVTYNSDLFQSQTIQHWFKGYIALLQEASRRPVLKIKDLSLIDNDERSRQLSTLNDSRGPYPELSVSDYLSQGFDIPTAEAVTMNGISISYAELDARSNRLARFLNERGAGRGDLIALHLDRSPEMVVALIGILKCGAAYLPLDPGFPAERLEFMLQDSQAKLLITEKGLSGALRGLSDSAILIDAERTIIDGYDDKPVATSNNIHDLAYVIYTSGSTGKPKGVQVTHGNVVNFLRSMARKPGLSRDDRLLAVTTLSFDISVLEVMLPLSVGATVVVAGKMDLLDGEKLRSLVEEQGITAMQATPATWRLLLSSNWQANKSMKVLCGGEALQRDLARDLISHVGEVWNMYGPTETTVWSTCCRLSDPDAPILIGRPIDNTQVYVLDEHLHLLPEGVFGELYIGGDGVTAGYLNRPELNAERFVNDPFTALPDRRLYRTGDLVRYRNSGDLEYGERVDNQVKVRGFRIELGEIEAAMGGHDGIAESVVIVREDQPGDQRLVAYYVVKDLADQPSVTELRKHLRKSLPDYMVPQHFMVLEAIPKTPNNKVDRKALSADYDATGSEEREYAEPGTEIEQELAAHWKKILKVSRVGRNDNFFDLGGHSLLSIQVISWAKQRYDVSIYPLSLITDTLSQVASQIGANAEPIRSVTAGEISESQDDATHRLSFVQRILKSLTAGKSGDNRRSA